MLDLGDNGTGLAELSLERLGEVDSDVIFLWVNISNPSFASDPSVVMDTALWSQLPAVRAGRVVEVGPHWLGVDSEAVRLVLSDLERLA